MVKMSDIAERAGVSTATVSLIINRKARASTETIAAVEKAMKDLKYNPKQRQHRRSRRRSGDADQATGDVLIAFKSAGGKFWRTPLYNDLVHGLESALTQKKMRTVLFRMTDDGSQIDQISADTVRGLIVPGSQDCVDQLAKSSVKAPVVSVFGEAVDGIDHVTSDHDQVGRLAAEHLLRLGHRSAAAIVDEQHPVYVMRKDAFTECFESGGGRVVTLSARDFSGHARFEETQGKAQLASLAKQYTETPDRPKALFSPSDAITAWLNAEWRRQGHDILQEVAVVTCNNERTYLDQLDVKPTVIDIHAEEVGARAVHTLFYRINHPHAPTNRVYITPKLIEGFSPTL